MKTRNQRKHIKIQTEEALSKKPIGRIGRVKQEKIDSIEIIASTSKPNVKLEAENLEKVFANIVVKKEVVDEAEAIASVLKPKQEVKLKVENIKDETVPIKGESVAEEKWMPKNWKQMIENIREMRKNRSAPVDTMGCHKCSDENASVKVII